MSVRWESGGAGLNEAELDLLADYTAGALDRTEASDVERLVASDQRWTRAYTALVEADEVVRGELRAAAGDAPAMPADVIARISTALSDAGQRADQAAAATSRGVVVSLDAARNRRRARAARFVGVAAVLLGIVGVGGYAVTQATSNATNSGTAAQAPDADQERSAGGLPLTALPSPATLPTLIVSGTNYNESSLGQLLAAADTAGAAAPGAPNLGKETTPSLPAAMRDAIEPPLDRLAEPAAIAACLAAIAPSHPGTPTRVEFARFDGEPAVIVVLRSGQTLTVVAVGPRCGLAGADELASRTS